MYRVFVEQLEFYGYHGVPDEEQAIGHRYCADISVLVAGSAHESDRLDGTVDYAELCRHVEFVARSEKYRTIERLGQMICQTVLMRFPEVRRIDLKLGKRLPPADVIAAAAGVEIMLERS